MTLSPHHGYSVGHPWYYLKGGAIPPLKAIRDHAEQGGYRGYLAEQIDALDARAEPRRSAQIADMRAKLHAGFREDVSRYRDCARALRRHREQDGEAAHGICEDVHVSISLKINHLINGFTNLRTLERLSHQGDLFDMV